MRIGRMNQIISSAVGDGVEVKNSEDVFYLMEIFFKQEEKCTDKIEDRLAKIVNENIRTGIGETKKKDLMAKHLKPQTVKI